MPYLAPSENLFTIQEYPASPSVQVKYNGSGIHSITGPVPMVSLNKSINRSGSGQIDNIATNINLSGKIVRYSGESTSDPNGSGIKSITKAIADLQQLFASCPIAPFEITCGTDTVLAVSGARVKSFNAERSENNWVLTADYSIELEYYEPSIEGSPLVSNTSDTWSIEPLDDYIYSSFSIGVSQRPEYNNPNLKPTAPTAGSTQPAGSLNGSNSSATLNIINVPQFRISHRLSAVGLPATGLCYSNTDNTNAGPGAAYLEAKKWVQQRADISLNYSQYNQNASYSGYPNFMNTPNIGGFDKTFLYNHIRTTNFSASEGSYEINDTWLAMPTGIKYVEDYSIDSSTDDKFVKTVRIQGNIKGLSIESFDIMGSGGMVPDKDGKIDLTYSSGQLSGPLNGVGGLLDVNSQSSSTNIHKNKYENAVDAWINDIKPYLYRRASLVLNSPDRTSDYINPAASPAPPPNNPIYCKENLLNIIPVSTAEGHDPRKGTISYSCEFTNRFKLISGVISESISISDTGPTDSISETVVIGRRLGPVIQSLNTKTSTRKDISIEVTVVPPSSVNGLFMTNSLCPLYTGGTVYTTIDQIVEGLKPFGDRPASIFGNLSRRNVAGQAYVSADNQSWNPADGRYSRQVTWIYQHCDNNYSNYLDT